MSDAPPKLRVRDLRKTYGSVVALADVSLELAEGEFFTLLGPSGSGKTTLLLVVAGLVPPDRGEVWIDGRLATYLPSHRRDIGLVFQHYALFPHLSVFENVAFPLRMRRWPQAAIARAVHQALETVRLPGVADRLPGQLSGGQQQRVALARCLVYRPSIVLMDEPLGALDKKLRDQMQLELKHLSRELGITVLYVTHDQEEAMILSDRIGLMNEGRLEQVGSPAELYFRPRTLFVAEFLGESNLLPARVVACDGARATLAGPGGARLSVADTGDLRPGEAVRVLVRPERLELLEAGAARDNVLAGTLREVILVGGVTRCYVSLAGGLTVSATRLTGAPGPSLDPGTPVRVGWAPDAAVVLREPPPP